jgi:mannose-1-phosphate guanylyltransferase/mannose-6-phosphate isomerase
MKITPVILSGGSGTRLWPISRKSNPKQFSNFFGEKSLFQKTILRFKNNQNFENPIIVCNEEHRFIVASQLQEIEVIPQKIILEPFARNTASAIAVASYAVTNSSSKIILILPSDHLILDENNFLEQIILAKKFAQENYLITFGITPKYEETGYGYIEKSEPIDGAKTIFKVAKFIEKPNKQKAQELIAQNNFYWNSGIFLFDSQNYLQNLEKFEKNIFIHAKNAFDLAKQDLDFTRLDANEFAKCPNISIDYAVMEKAQNIAIMPLEIDWKDVGSWNAIDDLSKQDDNQNSFNGEVVALKTKNCYIHSSQQLVATIGIENLIIVTTKDAILIANKNNSQDVKELFEKLKKFNSKYCDENPITLRPWGSFEIIDFGKNFKVKKIIVKPFCSLSLQKHQKRSEHWVVVKGRANVIYEDREFILNENESTYISLGKKHRLENKDKESLEIIEIQTGNYLGEDDIVRFNDKYGRDNGSF